jgi:ATP-dependent exoDNAse (exonuclease V) alpha subunit
MAILYFQISPISRGQGRSAVAAAAYRSGERIRDERTGKLHNHSRRDDIPHKEILLPSGLNAGTIPWVKNRAQLWNAAERAEHQRNSRVAREFQLGLPHELSAEQRLDLARGFSQQVADRYQVVVDLAIHLPRKGSDPRNHHAHLMLSSRQITSSGFGGKAGLDLQPGQMQLRGLKEGIAEIRFMRERWATTTNEALREAGLDLRVDHRTLAAQGIDRVPRARVPWSTVMRERKGLHSEIGERVRANHLARVQAKRQRALDLPSKEQPAPREQTIDDVRRQAREAWLQLRRGLEESPEGVPHTENSQQQSLEQPAADDDLSL